MKNLLRKGIILLSTLFLQIFPTNGQDFASNKTITIYVNKLQLSSDILNDFIAKSGCTIYKTDLSTNRYYCEFSIPTDKIRSLDSLSGKLGYVTQNTFNTENFIEKIVSLEKRIDGLHFENELYSKQLKDTTNSSRMKDELIHKLNNNSQTINGLEVSINKYKQNMSNQSCRVEYTINDELSTPTNSRVSFVNMPGIEYGFLSIENPRIGMSPKAFQGANIKYMFTRGKSYFNLGVYRALNNKFSDTSLISELFLINFGQDFYPRNFGRGKRQFLNLYTGYQVGGFITHQNNDQNSVFVPNANLSFGMEWIKTKHILVDNKISYFLPLNEYNRNLRGILYQASFNFVF